MPPGATTPPPPPPPASHKPNIAIAGLAIETSTFSPARTDASAFHALTTTDPILAYHSAVLTPALATAAHFHGALIGHALPGGTVTNEAFNSLTLSLIDRLKAICAEIDNGDAGEGLDGVWYDIHGAMCVEGVDDAEAVLLREVRAVVGSRCVVSASMDLHGNVSKRLAHGCDLLTGYRTAPHIDVVETRRRAVENLVEILRRGTRPLKAWVPIPILLPGEQTSTRDSPANEIYAAVPGVQGEAGVLDASVWVGYAWADEPRNRAAVVVTGWDGVAIAAGAEKLARLFWDRRNEFHFVAPTGTFAECLDAAVASDQRDRPFFVSDSGDNPTAGGSGDVSWGLREVLKRQEFQAPEGTGPVLIYASLPGPEAVAVAVAAGVGAMVTVTAGAAVDDLHAGPVTMTGRVHAIKHGDRDARVEVVVQVGKVYAILTALRKPYHKEKDFTDLGLKPREVDVVVVKIGYLEPELYDMASGWMLALTPGGVNQDLGRLGHSRIRRPMWPFDGGEWEPDLRARMIPFSEEVLVGEDE
ncbi:unnamed protein product [Discula destructiva]